MPENPYEAPKERQQRIIRAVAGFAAIPLFAAMAWAFGSVRPALWILPTVLGTAFALVGCWNAWALWRLR
jgi:hypothetical protein